MSVKRPKTDKKKDRGVEFETRRAAFRAAKRENGVPVTKQPDEVIRPGTKQGAERALDTRNRRLYIFRFILGLFGIRDGDEPDEVHIREDKAVTYSERSKQSDHFNAGKPPEKLKKHYYFKRK